VKLLYIVQAWLIYSHYFSWRISGPRYRFLYALHIINSFISFSLQFLHRYSIQWYTASLNVQKLILFLLQRGSKLLIMRFGGLFTGSLECLASVKLYKIIWKMNKHVILYFENIAYIKNNLFLFYRWRLHRYLILSSYILTRSHEKRYLFYI